MLIVLVMAMGGLVLLQMDTHKNLIRVAAIHPIAVVINKINRLSIPANNASCLKELEQRDVEFERLAAFSQSNRCKVEYTVRLARVGKMKLDNAPLLTCRMAMQLTEFEQDTLQPTAKRLLGSEINRLKHIGTYNCRSMRKYNGILSQHAFANAIDVSGFVLNNGSTINVEKDWKGSEAKSKFLKAVASKACKSFRVSVSPDSDANHFNHLHWDAGLYRSCS